MEVKEKGHFIKKKLKKDLFVIRNMYATVLCSKEATEGVL